MKTNHAIPCLAALLLAACGEKTSRPNSDSSAPPASRREGFLLTTDLPPELIEGTPRPIILPLRTPTPRHRPRPEFVRPPAPVPPPPRAAAAAPPPAWSPPPFPQPPLVERERYGELVDNAWQSPLDAPLSTFSIDVDTASYANLRRMILDGSRIPAEAVRLEELVNYFDYHYPQPDDGHPFAVHVANAVCPWNPDRQLVRVALKGAEIERTERPPANLVFLLDVSGSMNDPRKLPLVTASLALLVEELNSSDTLSIAVYAGAEGLVLPPTPCDAAGRQAAMAALQHLRAGGSTNGGAGITLAYQLARGAFRPGGVNRVILATDGDFNVGVTGDGALVQMVAANAREGIDLTVLGTGTGNLNDAMLEAITNKGNGNYHYLDSPAEARRIFLRKLTGTLVTIARDVKVQVEFNPARVRGYRLLGYANRMLRAQDFADDRIDAGEIGAGHAVTAFYEVETGAARDTTPAAALRYAAAPAHHSNEPASPAASPEWLTVMLRYQRPEGGPSTLVERPFTGLPCDVAAADDDFRFATAVAMTALLLRGDPDLADCRLADARQLASSALGPDPHGERAGFVTLLDHLAGRPR